MFRRFSPSEDVSGSVQLKSSAIRSIKQALAEQYPFLESSGALDEILPKKDAAVMEAKGRDAHKTSFVTVDGVPVFFRFRDGPFFPTLRLLHRYPRMMPAVRVDRGAIKFVLKGADIMCPGLTSAGADVSVELGEGAPVAVFAEGKEHAVATGLTKMSTADIRRLNKDVGVATVHFLGDQLWTSPNFA